MSPIASKLILTLYNSKVLEATDKLEDAKAWATEILGDQNSAKYYLSPENFIVAYKNNDSFSFLIDRDSLYSQMYGPNAYFDDREDEKRTRLSILGGLDIQKQCTN